MILIDAELLASQRAHLADRLAGKTVMVSGSTGLVGSGVVRYLMALNDFCGAGVKVVALYRDARKRDLLYPEEHGDVAFLAMDGTGLVLGDVQVDCVVHAAGISGGAKTHLKDPIRVFDVGLGGTRTLLDYAVTHGCKRFCYVSTYEVYGDATREGTISEEDPCNLDPMVLRNSYAEVKRTCESMLVAYSAAYGMGVVSGRLTSTFGEGVSYNDPRFFAEFGRCVAEGRDIVLKSSGSTVRCYLDVDDAASAFLYLLADGATGEAYNVADAGNVASIKNIADLFSRASGGRTRVQIDVAEDAVELGFRREGCTIVDSGKLEALGWKPVFRLRDTVEKLAHEFMNEHMRADGL